MTAVAEEAARGPVRGAVIRYAWLSVAAAIATIALKAGAYLFTGSVAVLSDALESIVNLVAAVVAVVALRVAEAPADDEHEHGHDKVEYFSSGLEGALVFAAAIAVFVAAISRLFEPRPLEDVGVGLALTTAASVVNLVVSLALRRAGKKHGSIALEADADHLMTDVWTSAGVLVGIALVTWTGQPWLDPLVAMGLAVFILRTGWSLLYRSGMGLLDVAVPAPERSHIEAILEGFREEGIDWHALRTRQAGTRRFVSVHVLVPGEWSVQKGHDLLERIEAAIRETAPRVTVMTHLEPIGDPCAYADQDLDR